MQRHWKRKVQDSASKMPKGSIGEVRTGGIWHLVSKFRWYWGIMKDPGRSRRNIWTQLLFFNSARPWKQGLSEPMHSLQNGNKTQNTLTKWWMCWKDGFSIKWLANSSSSMANLQYLQKQKCALKTLYNGLTFFTEWFVLVPKKYYVFNKKWQDLLKPTVYYKMASTTPFFP